MPLNFSCPACGHFGRCADAYAGRIVKCPQCGDSIELPPPAPPEGPSPSIDPTAAAPKRRERNYGFTIGLCLLAGGGLMAIVALAADAAEAIGGGAVLALIGLMFAVLAKAPPAPQIAVARTKPSPPEDPATVALRRLARIEQHAEAIRSYTGCLLAIAVIAAILVILGALGGGPQEVIIRSRPY